MKVLTPYNTHVGAISGSLPTLLGFTASLGAAGLVASPWAGHALWLFGMQTLWQMPHFYALAWLHRADYLRGGYDMFPLSDSTGYPTARMCKPYLVALCALPWIAPIAGLSSWMLPVGAFVPSAMWWQSLQAFEKKPSASSCRRFFLGSLSYLLAMLALFTAFARWEDRKPVALAPASMPRCTDDSICTTHESADAEKPTVERMQDTIEFRGPMWRSAVHAAFLEACPHEQLRGWVFGTCKASCPFSHTPR